jgi:hypothetical protein
MAPVATNTGITMPSVATQPIATPVPKGDIRASPWHELAHSLSATSLQRAETLARRESTPSLTSTPPLSHSQTPLNLEALPSEDVPGQLSTSQALRTWERLLSAPDSDVRRHALVQPRAPPSPLPVLTPAPAPKLAAERDKEGHIEYKLKLIDPTPERFEKLVTQMMWRLKQGKNEAIYEIGLAGTSLYHHSVQAETDSDVL